MVGRSRQKNAVNLPVVYTTAVDGRNLTIKQLIEVLVRLMSVVNLSIIILSPNSAVVTENGRILQISVQHQHCENGLQSFNESYST